MKITLKRRGDKYIFCKDGVYFSLSFEEFDDMEEAILDARVDRARRIGGAKWTELLEGKLENKLNEVKE